MEVEVESSDDQDRARLQDWVDKLDDLIAKLDGFEGDSPIDFCEHAMDAWQGLVSPDTAPPPRSAAMVVIVETMRAQAEVMGAAAMDYVKTPDVRNRMTRSDAQGSLCTALKGIAQHAKNWLLGDLPSGEEIARIIAESTGVFEELQEQGRKQVEQDAADDSAAAADPYGAVLGYSDPSVDAAIVFTKVCSFTEAEDANYRDSHERLRKMIDSELLRHISDESERLFDVLIEVLSDMNSRRFSLSDQDAFDERRRRLRSALISFTSAIHSHKDQSIRAVREKFGRKTPEEKQVIELFDNLLESSFDYRWLIKMRDTLLHGDIDAFKIQFTARLGGESEVNVFMDRDCMLTFNKEAREKWLKLSELVDMSSDPSVLDMIKSAQPRIMELQDQLDVILYPSVIEDVETVNELIGRFEGRAGLYALQSGPGFTRKLRVPPYTFLAPRVLSYASVYKESPSSSE